MNDVSKDLGRVKILDSINFAIAPGEMLAAIGRAVILL
ncbi:hypothetical protein X767_01250 [Mesorhizobium sp. LSJC264A00]|nr:hypothetical protein X767_01250 [Mesorhizobium sp. LSJC264A00]